MTVIDSLTVFLSERTDWYSPPEISQALVAALKAKGFVIVPRVATPEMTGRIVTNARRWMPRSKLSDGDISEVWTDLIEEWERTNA